jgi:transcriptional regulator with XRE-family HTH domain
MTNKEKFLALVSGKESETILEIKERNRNREMIEESQIIALKVLTRLDELQWSQKTLAEKMDVSPQQINKLVKGQENLTITTIIKLQEVLKIPILASYYEKALEKLGEIIMESIRQEYKKPEAKVINIDEYKQSISYGQQLNNMVAEPQVDYENYFELQA